LKFDILLVVNGVAVFEVEIVSMFFNDLMLFVFVSDSNMFVINNVVYMDKKMEV
jgi:hypothetical protein